MCGLKCYMLTLFCLWFTLSYAFDSLKSSVLHTFLHTHNACSLHHFIDLIQFIHKACMKRLGITSALHTTVMSTEVQCFSKETSQLKRIKAGFELLIWACGKTTANPLFFRNIWLTYSWDHRNFFFVVIILNLPVWYILYLGVAAVLGLFCQPHPANTRAQCNN